MVGADLLRGGGLLRAAVHVERRGDRRACARRRARDRLLPAGGLRGRAEPRAGGAAARRRTRCSRRSRTSAGRSARCSAASSPRRQGRTPRTGSTPSRSSSPRVLVARIPKRLLQSETALTRGHWRDLADGFVAVLRSRPLLAVLVGWGIASLGIGAISLIEVFLAKNTLHAGDFGYGLLYGGIGTGLVLGSWWSSYVVERFGTTRAYAGALARHGGRLRCRRGGAEHLGRCGVLPRRRHRRRRGDRLQRAARAARRGRPPPRPRADARDERDLRPERRRHRDRGRAGPRRPARAGSGRAAPSRSRSARSLRSPLARREARAPDRRRQPPSRVARGGRPPRLDP